MFYSLVQYFQLSYERLNSKLWSHFVDEPLYSTWQICIQFLLWPWQWPALYSVHEIIWLIFILRWQSWKLSTTTWIICSDHRKLYLDNKRKVKHIAPKILERDFLWIKRSYYRQTDGQNDYRIDGHWFEESPPEFWDIWIGLQKSSFP